MELLELDVQPAAPMVHEGARAGYDGTGPPGYLVDFGCHSEAGEPFWELAKGAPEVDSLVLGDHDVVGVKPSVQGQAELVLVETVAAALLRTGEPTATSLVGVLACGCWAGEAVSSLDTWSRSLASCSFCQLRTARMSG